MKKTSNLEIGAMIYFLTRASFVGICFNIISSLSKQQSFISIILATILGIIPVCLYLYIFNYEKELSLNEKNIKLLGNKLGNIINIILKIVTFIFIIILFNNIISIIHNEYLNKTPLFLIALYFIITIYYCIKKDIYTISKACLLILYISIFIFIICNISLLFQININNFKPFNNNILTSTYYYTTLNILPLYLINIIPKNRINKNSKTNITIIIFYILSNITLLIENINIIGVLGIKLCRLYKYPEMQILKNISLIGLSSRIDSIVFIKWIFDITLFIIIGMYYITSINNHKKDNISSIIYCLILFIISLIIPNSILNITTLKPIIILINTILFTITLLLCYKIKYSKKVQTKN